jgi:hypothetical protein
MVLYKPSKPYLLRVLDNAASDFGGEYMVQVSNALSAQGLTGLVPAVAADNQNNHIISVNSAQQPLPTGPNLTQATHEQLDAILRDCLQNKLTENPTWRDGTVFDRHTVEELEEKFRMSEHLEWNDFDFAYAYEGAIIPGGKIMMGRWWRMHQDGSRDSSEWNDTIDDEASDVEMGGTDSSYRFIRYERGPFVFWS